MKSLLFLAIFLYPFVLFSQPLPENLQFSYQIEGMVAKQEMRTTSASYYYTFIGDYLNAISTSDIKISWGVDTLDVAGLQIAPALPQIIAHAKNERIIIISESHNKPQHRIFARQLIDSLQNYGFLHLGLEALSPYMRAKNQSWDSTLQERGYPLMKGTGYYAREPQMANLIRSGIKNGMQLFGYENGVDQSAKDRDEIQAENVIRFMQNSGTSKIILLCGFHHANESEDIKRKNSFWMAKYIKDKTGIDPLTIYQDNFTEKAAANQHKFLDDCAVKTPSVFIDSLGDIARLSRQVDVEIIHPTTRFIDGRPSWLFQNGDYKSFYFGKIPNDATYPLLLMAFLPGEENDGVPIDVFEMKDRYDRKALVLPPGEYLIRVLGETFSIDSQVSVN